MLEVSGHVGLAERARAGGGASWRGVLAEVVAAIGELVVVRLGMHPGGARGDAPRRSPACGWGRGRVRGGPRGELRAAPARGLLRPSSRCLPPPSSGAEALAVLAEAFEAMRVALRLVALGALVVLAEARVVVGVPALAMPCGAVVELERREQPEPYPLLYGRPRR